MLLNKLLELDEVGAHAVERGTRDRVAGHGNRERHARRVLCAQVGDRQVTGSGREGREKKQVHTTPG